MEKISQLWGRLQVCNLRYAKQERKSETPLRHLANSSYTHARRKTLVKLLENYGSNVAQPVTTSTHVLCMNTLKVEILMFNLYTYFYFNLVSEEYNIKLLNIQRQEDLF